MTDGIDTLPHFVPSTVFTEWTVGDLSIPCDFADEAACTDSPAKWVLFCTKCPCGRQGVWLACDTCKTLRLESEDGVACDCGEVWIPARLAYTRCEAI